MKRQRKNSSFQLDIDDINWEDFEGPGRQKATGGGAIECESLIHVDCPKKLERNLLESYTIESHGFGASGGGTAICVGIGHGSATGYGHYALLKVGFGRADSDYNIDPEATAEECKDVKIIEK